MAFQTTITTLFLINIAAGIELGQEDSNACLEETSAGLRISPQTYFMAVENSCESTIQEMKRSGTPLHLVTNKDAGEQLGKYVSGNAYSMAEELLKKELDLVEIMSLETSWVPFFEASLLTLENDTTLTSMLDSKYFSYRDNGELVAIAEHADQQVLYYNTQVFKYLGVTQFPTSWDDMSNLLSLINNTGFFKVSMGIPFSGKDDILDAAATIYSGFSSTPLISKSGEIAFDKSTMNNAFGLIKDWQSQGLLTFKNSPADTVEDLKNGQIAVALLWTSSSVEIEAFLSQIANPNLIKMAPIPGNGRGASRHRSVSLNKHMRSGVVAPAQQFVLLHAEHTLPISNLFGSVGSLPLWNPSLDGDYMASYCSSHRVICNALSSHNDFFEETALPLASSCQSSHVICETIILRRLKEFFDDVPLPSDLGTTLHDDLHKITVGYKSQIPIEENEESEIIPKRVMMSISVAVIGLSCLALFLYTKRCGSYAFKSKGFHAPMPVLLTCVVTVAFVSLTVAISETSSTANDNITMSMNRKIAQLYLSSVDSAISLSIDGIRTSELTTYQAILHSNSHTRFVVQRMNAQLGRSPLIVIVNTETGLVILSSDEEVQKNSIEPNHPWTIAALKTVKDAHNNFIDVTDPLETVSLDTDIGGIFVNRQIIRAGGIQFDHLTLVAFHITSKWSVTEQSDWNHEEVVYFGVFCSSFGIFVISLLTIAVSSTLMPLASEIYDIANGLKLPVRNRVQSAKSSILFEVSALDLAFSGLCRTLTEYKRFMPSSLLHETFIKSRSSTGDESVLLIDDGTSSDDFLSRMVMSANKPPVDRNGVAIAFTDVDHSTSLWECCQRTMRESLSIHENILRSCLEVSDSGYEVKTIGDSFLCAFQNPSDAVSWAFAVQFALLNASWPPALLEPPMLNYIPSKSNIWNGLRISAGIHFGKVEVEENILTGRADYFGTTVNLAARIQEAAVGGGVGVSDVVLSAISSRSSSKLSKEKRHHIVTSAELYLRGIEGVTVVSVIVPYGLKSRSFEIDKQFRTTHEIQNPLQLTATTADFEREASTSRSSHIVIGSDTSVPHSMHDHFATTSASTATISINYSSLNTMASSSKARNFISTVVSSCATAASRCNGSIHSTCGSSIIVSWGGTQKDAYHIYNSIRFVDLLSRKSGRDGRSDVRKGIDNLSIGICSDVMVSGNVGKSEKYNVLLANGLSLSSELASAAKEAGIVCLIATLLDDVQLHDKSLFKSLFIGTIVRVVDSIKINSRLIHIYQLCHSRLLPPHTVDTSEFDIQAHTWSTHNDAYLNGEGFLHEDPVLSRITEIKQSKKHLVQFCKGMSRTRKRSK
eukprot:TRINITY_DN1416_c1_g2_i1.p1 TRINITY_DN1416_c1_g2~~TRINITY_DN1416_c1_g2_i1.p1  ORF type:complete len:1335 (+),score=230.35 TRINITY_DN1416_c1_g2_i1:100-4104(+)